MWAKGPLVFTWHLGTANTLPYVTNGVRRLPGWQLNDSALVGLYFKYSTAFTFSLRIKGCSPKRIAVYTPLNAWMGVSCTACRVYAMWRRAHFWGGYRLHSNCTNALHCQVRNWFNNKYCVKKELYHETNTWRSVNLVFILKSLHI